MLKREGVERAVIKTMYCLTAIIITCLITGVPVIDTLNNLVSWVFGLWFIWIPLFILDCFLTSLGKDLAKRLSEAVKK